jgi:hypothetical protein
MIPHLVDSYAYYERENRNDRASDPPIPRELCGESEISNVEMFAQMGEILNTSNERESDEPE